MSREGEILRAQLYAEAIAREIAELSLVAAAIAVSVRLFEEREAIVGKGNAGTIVLKVTPQ